MIGDHNAVDVCLAGSLGILWIEDALQNDLAGKYRPHPFDVFPVCGRIEIIVHKLAVADTFGHGGGHGSEFQRPAFGNDVECPAGWVAP